MRILLLWLLMCVQQAVSLHHCYYTAHNMLHVLQHTACCTSHNNPPESCDPGGGPVNWPGPEAVVPVPLAGACAGAPVAGAGAVPWAGVVPVGAGALCCWAGLPEPCVLGAAGGGSSLGISGIPFKLNKS